MNMSTILGQEHAYRRGLVLGLTLAEVITLVLFVLLLALASLVLDHDREQAALAGELAKAREEALTLKTTLQQISSTSGIPEEELPDLFAELAQARERLDAVEHENTALKKALAEQSDLIEAVAPYVEAGAGGSPDKVSRALAAQDQVARALAGATAEPDHEKAAQLIEALAKAIPGFPEPVDPRALIEDLSQSADRERAHETLERQLADLRQQNQWYQERLGGHGVEMPSCWFDSAGRTEYIFDVALGEPGLQLRPTNLPHREQDRAALPSVEVVTDGWLDPDAFLSVTRPLFEWSVEQECRFFVRAFDVTPHQEKELYKARLQTVEQHFYKLLVPGDRF
jgi:hypothetical protein